MASPTRWIPVRGAEGEHSRQAHADMPAGTYEREVSKEGFFGPAAFFHHRRPPTGWTRFEGPLRPRAFDLMALNEAAASPWSAPRVLGNAHVEIRFWKLAGPMPRLARNADGDQLLFVHQGGGELFCDYGRLAFRPGDYVYLPRGTMWRLSPEGPAALLAIEATGAHYTLPDRGLLGPHALFDPAVLETPAMDEAFRAHQDLPGEVSVEVKKRGAVSTVTFPYNPLDAVGWHGDLAPARLNVADLRPVTSHRYHLPPSAHTTFVGERFVVCTFAPRPFETDPGALKVPFFHNNDDYDEVLFYHAGDFFSRDHIEAGAMTFHPSGFTHGPHPKALKSMLVQQKPATDEYAVMIDARDPLDVAEAAAAVENAAYVDSWRGAMKLASLKGGRDGRLAVVSRDLAWCAPAEAIAPTLQGALDDWERCAPLLAGLAESLEHGAVPRLRFHEHAAASPLPRAYQWADGSAYLNHVVLARQARGAEMPQRFATEPLVYQGGSDGFLGPRDPIPLGDPAWGCDFEAETAVILGDVAAGADRDAALKAIRLVMLANDVSLRGLITQELAKGFGFFQSKPAGSFSPVAVTPEELEGRLQDGRLSGVVEVALNGVPFGRPETGKDMTFDFGTLIAHCARTRALAAGTIVGSGTISNRGADGGPGAPIAEGGAGFACIAERRAVETLRGGTPRTPFLGPGDTVRIEMRGPDRRSIFGAIEQTVVAA